VSYFLSEASSRGAEERCSGPPRVAPNENAAANVGAKSPPPALSLALYFFCLAITTNFFPRKHRFFLEPSIEALMSDLSVDGLPQQLGNLLYAVEQAVDAVRSSSGPQRSRGEPFKKSGIFGPFRKKLCSTMSLSRYRCVPQSFPPDS
jgi:hypothetical protein